MYDCSAKQHIPFLTLLTQRKSRKPVGTQRICAVCTFSLTPPGFPRSRLVPSSLCTTSTLAVWPNRPSQSRISPTVPMLSVTGRPRGYAWCGGSPWGSRPGPGHRCAARSQLLSSIYILQLLSFVTGDGGCACPSSSAVCLFSAMAAKICSCGCWGFLENAGATGSCARDVLYPLIKETQM